MLDLMFYTTNSAKVELANYRLNGYDIKVTGLARELIEPQVLDVTEVAMQKACQLKQVAPKPFIVEDSGLYINALNGFPGALMKPVLDSIGSTGLLKIMDGVGDRSTEVKSVLVYCNPISGVTEAFHGTYKGSLSTEPLGTVSRGWKVSQIFMPLNSRKTLAEMDDKEWSAFLEEFRKDDHYEQFGKWVSAKASGKILP